MVPTVATEGAAGFDLTATSLDTSNSLFDEYGTGIAVEIPRGYVGLLFPRSSISKIGCAFANSVGVIDSDYRGEIRVRTYGVMVGSKRYEVGHKIAQLLVVPIPAVEYEMTDELTATARDPRGFGTTGM